ncbi:MAG: hypothetical protein J0H64_01205, partial [Actinobacteria bacterium]|nr:hypothetical protein [Actinomycetota bacterium]
MTMDSGSIASEAPRAMRRASGTIVTAGWVLAVVLPLGFLLLFFVWPVLALIATGFTSGPALGGTAVSGAPGTARLDLSGIAEVFGEARTWRVIGQTMLQAVGGTILSLLLGVPAAFVLYRL